MLCHECQKENEESIVTRGVTLSTLIHVSVHFDRKGGEHYHDPNTYTTDYTCSRGHSWKAATKMPRLCCVEEGSTHE